MGFYSFEFWRSYIGDASCFNCYESGKGKWGILSTITASMVGGRNNIPRHCAGPVVRKDLATFDPGSLVDCWVRTEHYESDLKRCLEVYSKCRWEPIENITWMLRTVNSVIEQFEHGVAGIGVKISQKATGTSKQQKRSETCHGKITSQAPVLSLVYSQDQKLVDWTGCCG